MSDTHHRLRGARVLLGVTGGIAAYKAVELARELGRAGAEVQPLLTADAKFAGATGHRARVQVHPVSARSD